MVQRGRKVNPQRENVSDIKTDNVAKNLLASKSKNYENTGKKSTVKSTKGKKLNPLIPKKVCSLFSDTELLFATVCYCFRYVFLLEIISISLLTLIFCVK